MVYNCTCSSSLKCGLVHSRIILISDFHRPLSPGAQSRLSVVSDALSFHSCQFDADDEPIDFFEPVAMETEQSAMTDVIDIEGGGDMLRGRVTKEDGPPSVDVNCLVNKQSDLGGR